MNIRSTEKYNEHNLKWRERNDRVTRIQDSTNLAQTIETILPLGWRWAVLHNKRAKLSCINYLKSKVSKTFILTAQTSTNVALNIETILTRFEDGGGAEWRHVRKIKLEYLLNYSCTNIYFDCTNQHKRSTNDRDHFDAIWRRTGGWVTSCVKNQTGKTKKP